ncbi:hypothetical protein R2G56_08200 [Nitratireductor aquimarinus]|uniref:Uncharacterized protein n=1 Tax=Nitratireductor aquimarinus TaxID=889300 RepID=A0ABU4AJ55_9HYPH|nr:hypothetical protein [Nitratireductor aquimarinus]MDV6226264.1 hypothetical protein [Nitratireductor aquimarinus]
MGWEADWQLSSKLEKAAIDVGDAETELPILFHGRSHMLKPLAELTSNDRIGHFSGYLNTPHGQLTFASPFKKFLKAFGRFGEIARLAAQREVGRFVASTSRHRGKVVDMTAPF